MRTAASPTGIMASGATPIRCGPAAAGALLAARPYGTAVCQSRRRKPIPHAGGRRRPQFHPALQIAQRAGDLSFRPSHAAAGLGAALARRLYECVLDRELHGRTGAGRRRRSGRIPSAGISTTTARPRCGHHRGETLWLVQTSRSGRRDVATALPLRATKISPPIAPSPRKSKSSAIPAARGWCARSQPSTAAQAVNPDGLINQIEGAILQSMSWTLLRKRDLRRHPHHQHRLVDATRSFVSTMSRQRRCPCHRPAWQPFLGSGEAGQGPPLRRSPMPSPDATGNACAICRSRAKRIKAATAA